MTLARLSSTSVLQRLLGDDAALARIPTLDPAGVVQLVRSVGLEDAGELVSLLSTPQLEAVFDDDLWHRTRRGERFDPARFALWLEVMLEMGASRAAAVVGDLLERDPAVLVHGFSCLVRVFDLDVLALRGQRGGDDDELDGLDDELHSRRSQELDRFLVVAVREDAFDAVVEILTALDEADVDGMRRLLRRVGAITAARVEDAGLVGALDEGATAALDARDARDERRAARGFVSVDDARAFLALADRGLAGDDPISRAALAPHGPGRLVAATTTTRALTRTGPHGHLRAALAALDVPTRQRRELEIAWLGNVVVAADACRPADAALLVLDTIERALAAAAADERTHVVDLAAIDAVTWFGRGRARRPR